MKKNNIRILALSLFSVCLCSGVISAQEKERISLLPEDVDITGRELSVKSGELAIKVPFKGSSIAQDVVQITSPIEGRVMELYPKLFSPVGPDKLVAKLITKDLAAMLDASPEKGRSQLAERWKQVYKYQDVFADNAGVITNIYVRPNDDVYEGDALFDVAKKFMIVAKTTKRTYRDIHPGLEADVLHVKTGRRYRAVIETVSKSKDSYILWLSLGEIPSEVRVGDAFSGDVLLVRKENTKTVPRDQIYEKNGKTYLMLEVETGLMTDEDVEIMEPKLNYLVLKPHTDPNMARLSEADVRTKAVPVEVGKIQKKSSFAKIAAESPSGDADTGN